MCGGTVTVQVRIAAKEGLSPRVRGNRDITEHEIQASGSIPACAGEPHYYNETTESDGVYPRVCGGT